MPLPVRYQKSNYISNDISMTIKVTVTAVTSNALFPNSVKYDSFN